MAIWVACYFLPQYAGDWWDSAFFPFFQSLVSLFLIVMARRLLDRWYLPEYLALCVLGIAHNVGDALLQFEPDHYNHIATVLNGLELFVLLGCGGITEIIKVWRNGRTPDGPDSGLRRTSLPAGTSESA